MLTLDGNGWCREALRLPSPNHDSRPPGTLPDLIVIHNISLPPGQYGGDHIADLFLNRLDFDAHPWFERLRSLRVSAHFLLRRDGALLQFVSADDRAWHSGASVFQERTACNDFSIGIELEGSDDEPFTDAQYAALAKLTTALCLRYPVSAITGHQHIAPDRKTDPGPCFDWPRFERMTTVLSTSSPMFFYGKG